MKEPEMRNPAVKAGSLDGTVTGLAYELKAPTGSITCCLRRRQRQERRRQRQERRLRSRR